VSDCLRDRIGSDDQLGGVTEFRLQNGVRVARLQTSGGIDALLNVDRAMDVAQLSFGGTPLVWHGPGGLLPSHPATLDDDAFQRQFFGGLVTTCGLEAFGPAGEDRYGSWGTHGHINHCAADAIATRVDFERDPPSIELRGTVRQVRMFGESLRLERAWTAELNGTALRLHDRVVNDGGATVPHMLLYHCNAGYPLVDEHAEVYVSHDSVEPRDDVSRAALGVWNRGGPPLRNFHEEVFVHTPRAEANGWARAGIRNRKLRGGVGFTVRYRPEQLCVCFSWRMLGVRTYVLSVEPANCPTIEGRLEARRRGTLPMIEPGESREYDLEFSFTSGPQA
jgi:hypothetical protein